jgi:hypothetical protein
MKSIKTVQPGQNGTKGLVKKYGDKLFCVRYRYNPKAKQCLKTIEIIISRKAWEPKTDKPPPNKIVSIKVKYGEVHIGRLVKSAGGIWNREHKCWEIRYDQVVALGLEDRMINL